MVLSIPFEEFSSDQIEDFAKNEYLIIDDFLPQDMAEKLLKELKFWRKKNKFKKGGIGKSLSHKVVEEVRRDEIKWIQKDSCLPHTAAYMEYLDKLSTTLNRNFFLSLKDMEAMYAIYEKGAFYKTHRDRFHSQPHRVISVVLYLNPNWKPTHGGELVIHTEGTKKTGSISIEPVYNRLALFRSELLHEVVPCHKTRYSVTTWLKDQLNEVTFLAI
jgi:SM-20-related protein